MKGIHIVPNIEEEASGPSYSVVRLCESLNKINQYTILISLGDKRSKLRFHKTFPRVNLFYRLGISPLMKDEIDRLVKEGSIEYIHSHGLWMMPNIYAGLIAKKYRIPLIISPRGALSRQAMRTGLRLVKVAFWILFQKNVLKSATYFHATSKSECSDIQRMGFRQPAAVIPNGIDIQKIGKITESSQMSLLFLGRIHPIKGIENLLHAWVSVQNQFPNWKLQIAGPGDKKYINKIKSLSRDLLAERVYFLGPLYGADKWNAYRSADLYILPSFSENFGMTVAESLSVGTPVITSKGAPWSGLVNRNAGFWVDSDILSLKLCLSKTLYLSRKELYKMGINGAEWMQDEFSWDTIALQMLEVYRLTSDTNKSNPPF
jgi:glycosyltransferase involved in cell wall biosynthesis